MITIEAATNESGMEPPDLFKFNMRARHAVTGQEREFEVVDMQYKDGQVIEMFVEVSKGPLHHVTVSCTNRYGMSEESDAQTVFSAGKYAQDAKVIISVKYKYNGIQCNQRLHGLCNR